MGDGDDTGGVEGLVASAEAVGLLPMGASKIAAGVLPALRYEKVQAERRRLWAETARGLALDLAKERGLGGDFTFTGEQITDRAQEVADELLQAFDVTFGIDEDEEPAPAGTVKQ